MDNEEYQDLREEIYREAHDVVRTANRKIGLSWFEIADVSLTVRFGEQAERFWVARLGVERNWEEVASNPVSALAKLRKTIRSTPLPPRYIG